MHFLIFTQPAAAFQCVFLWRKKHFRGMNGTIHFKNQWSHCVTYVKMASFHIKSQQEGKTFNERICFYLLFLKAIFDTFKTLQRVVWSEVTPAQCGKTSKHYLASGKKDSSVFTSSQKIFKKVQAKKLVKSNKSKKNFL